MNKCDWKNEYFEIRFCCGKFPLFCAHNQVDYESQSLATIAVHVSIKRKMISNKTENIKNKRNQAKYTKIKPHKNFFFFKKEAKD